MCCQRRAFRLLEAAIIACAVGSCLTCGARDQGAYPSFAEAGAQFAVDLYLKLVPASPTSALFPPAIAPDARNVCFSPYGVSWILDAALAGAEGNTRTELASALHLNPFGEEVSALAQEVKESLESAPEGDVDLEAAMAIWVQEGFPILPVYLALLDECYGVAARQVDFRNHRKQAAVDINAWASEKTGGAIPEVVKEERLSWRTALILVSAVHFLGKWATPFSAGPASTPSSAPFYFLSGGTAAVPMMHAVAPARYAANGTAEVLALPYVGERIEFVVFLPAEGWFEDFRAGLSGRMILDLLAALGPVTADVTLPKFSVRNGWDLNQALQHLGIIAAFTDRAEFGGISPEPLAIDSVVQTARIEVDEQGTHADAATAVSMISVGIAPKAPPRIVFRVDRPFLFAVWDRETRTILFFGHVVDPRGQEA